MAYDKDAWEINARDVRQAKEDGKYDDCLACRVTGMPRQFRFRSPDIMSPIDSM